MRRTLLSLTVSFVLVFATAFAAYGGGFHFKTKSISFSLGSLTFEGVGVGLGNTDYEATMDAEATVRVLCVNKYDGRKVLGQTEFESVPGVQDHLVQTEDKGKTLVSLTVQDPSVYDLGYPPNPYRECPYGKWYISDVVVMEWTSAEIEVTELGSGELLLGETFECSGGGVAVDYNGKPISDGYGGFEMNPVSCSSA